MVSGCLSLDFFCWGGGWSGFGCRDVRAFLLDFFFFNLFFEKAEVIRNVSKKGVYDVYGHIGIYLRGEW